MSSQAQVWLEARVAPGVACPTSFGFSRFVVINGKPLSSDNRVDPVTVVNIQSFTTGNLQFSRIKT